MHKQLKINKSVNLDADHQHVHAHFLMQVKATVASLTFPINISQEKCFTLK